MLRLQELYIVESRDQLALIPEGKALLKAFADVVADIVDKGMIPELSQRSYNRIRSNYTEDIVYNRLKEEYNTLFSLYHYDKRIMTS